MNTDIEKLESLAKAATPGPWQARNEFGFEIFPTRGGGRIASGRSWTDLRFIEASNPAAVPELIAEIRRLQDAVERLKNPPGDLIDEWSLVEKEQPNV